MFTWSSGSRNLYCTIPYYHIQVIDRGPKDHINVRILHSGSKAQYKGIPEIMVSRILMFML